MDPGSGGAVQTALLAAQLPGCYTHFAHSGENHRPRPEGLCGGSGGGGPIGQAQQGRGKLCRDFMLRSNQQSTSQGRVMRKDKKTPLLPEGPAGSARASRCCISGPQSLCEPWQRQAHPWDPRWVVGVMVGGGRRGQQHPRSSTGHTGRALLHSRRFCVRFRYASQPDCQPRARTADLPGVRLPVGFLWLPQTSELPMPHPGLWPRAGQELGCWSPWGQKQLQVPLASPVTHVLGSSLPEHLGSAGALLAPQPTCCSRRLLSRRRITETPTPVKSEEPQAAGSHRESNQPELASGSLRSSSHHGGQAGAAEEQCLSAGAKSRPGEGAADSPLRSVPLWAAPRPGPEPRCPWAPVTRVKHAVCLQAPAVPLPAPRASSTLCLLLPGRRARDPEQAMEPPGQRENPPSQ